jgi:hypothetical protein
MLLFNKSVTLVGTVRTKDTDGFAVESEKLFTGIPAAYQSVYSNEFYSANMQGIKTDLMVVISDVNYSGETRVIDEETNHTFNVIRAYKNGFNVELTVTDLGVVQGG